MCELGQCWIEWKMREMPERVTKLAESMDEFRRMVPDSFGTAYEQLWAAAYSDGGVDGGAGLGGGGNHPLNGKAGELGREAGKPTGQWPVRSSEVTSVGGKSSGPGSSLKAVGKTARTMRDERAFKLKVKVDKRLRKIAREVLASLEGRNVLAATQRVCAGRCKKYGEVDWTYCAHCGGPMREIEETEVGK